MLLTEPGSTAFLAFPLTSTSHSNNHTLERKGTILDSEAPIFRTPILLDPCLSHPPRPRTIFPWDFKLGVITNHLWMICKHFLYPSLQREVPRALFMGDEVVRWRKEVDMQAYRLLRLATRVDLYRHMRTDDWPAPHPEFRRTLDIKGPFVLWGLTTRVGLLISVAGARILAESQRWWGRSSAGWDYPDWVPFGSPSALKRPLSISVLPLSWPVPEWLPGLACRFYITPCPKKLHWCPRR